MDLKPRGGLNAIEVAPLVVEANPILPLDDSGRIAKAEAEVADAEERTQRWARERDAVAGRAISIPITSLTGGELTVRASLDDPVQRVKELIKEARGAAGPEPDAQCLVLMLQSGEQRPLEDETVQLGAWGVAEGMTLHLNPQDPVAGRERRECRQAARAAAAERRQARALRNAKLKRLARNLLAGAVAIGLILVIVYLTAGCGGGSPCGEYGDCVGLFTTACVCHASANYVGEHCNLAPAYALSGCDDPALCGTYLRSEAATCGGGAPVYQLAGAADTALLYFVRPGWKVAPATETCNADTDVQACPSSTSSSIEFVDLHEGGGCGPVIVENADSASLVNCDREYILGSGFDTFFAERSANPITILQDAHDPNDATWDHDDFVELRIRAGVVARVYLFVPEGQDGHGHEEDDQPNTIDPLGGWADTGETYTEDLGIQRRLWTKDVAGNYQLQHTVHLGWGYLYMVGFECGTCAQCVEAMETWECGDLEVYYQFAGNVDDLSGTNHGTISGATFVTDRLGQDNHALRFDGDDVVTLDSPFPATDTEFTIALWLSTELTNDGAFHGFIGYQDGGVCPGRSPSMWVGRGETLHYDSCESGTRFQGVLQQYFPVAEVNQYQHVVWTKIGVESQFYKNGEKFGDVIAAPEHVQLSERYWIGRVDNYFTGTIDEVAIFDYGASAADVAALYTRTATLSSSGGLRCNDPRDATDRIQSPVEVFGNAWASWRSSSSGETVPVSVEAMWGIGPFDLCGGVDCSGVGVCADGLCNCTGDNNTIAARGRCLSCGEQATSNGTHCVQ